MNRLVKPRRLLSNLYYQIIPFEYKDIIASVGMYFFRPKVVPPSLWCWFYTFVLSIAEPVTRRRDRCLFYSVSWTNWFNKTSAVLIFRYCICWDFLFRLFRYLVRLKAFHIGRCLSQAVYLRSHYFSLSLCCACKLNYELLSVYKNEHIDPLYILTHSYVTFASS